MLISIYGADYHHLSFMDIFGDTCRSMCLSIYGADYHHLDLHILRSQGRINPWIAIHGDDAMCTSCPYGAKVSAALGSSNYSALIGIHTFSGCDSTIGNGWHIEDGELTVTVMTTNPAPESVLQLVHCSCKTSKRETERCSLGVCLQDCLDLCQGQIHSMRMFKRKQKRDLLIG